MMLSEQAASRSWKGKEMDSSLQPSAGHPANTVTSAPWDIFQEQEENKFEFLWTTWFVVIYCNISRKPVCISLVPTYFWTLETGLGAMCSCLLPHQWSSTSKARTSSIFIINPGQWWWRGRKIANQSWIIYIHIVIIRWISSKTTAHKVLTKVTISLY